MPVLGTFGIFYQESYQERHQQGHQEAIVKKHQEKAKKARSTHALRRGILFLSFEHQQISKHKVQLSKANEQ